MTIRDILPKLGIDESMIVMASGDIDAEIDNGYELQKTDILTGNMVQIIKVHPNVGWSDGTFRPTYGLGGWKSGQGATLYLNARI